MKTWYIGHTKDGFQLGVCENSTLGVIIAAIIEGADLEWWGKYKNLPFCWINPWSWTFAVGTVDHNLGRWWASTGNAVLDFAWKLKKEHTIISFPLTDEQVKTRFPEQWEWFAEMLAWKKETEEDGDEDAQRTAM